MRSTRCRRTDAAISIAVALLLWAAAASLRAQAIDPPATAHRISIGLHRQRHLSSSRARPVTGSTAAARPAASSASTSTCRTSPTARSRRRSRWATGSPSIHEGGPVRGLDRHMPAFGDALTDAEIEAVIEHLWTFCDDPAWPRGELNLPRPLVTEKAFPENEAVCHDRVRPRAGRRPIGNEIVYEQRLGARNQFEVAVPLDVQQKPRHGWSRGLGDVASRSSGRCFRSLDTRPHRQRRRRSRRCRPARKAPGFGNGVTMFEPFASVRPDPAARHVRAGAGRHRSARRTTAAAATRRSGAPPSAAR